MDVHGAESEFKELGNPIMGIWNARGKEDSEGLPDHYQKDLEVAAILKHIRQGMVVLDVGCGNGQVPAEIAKVAASVQGIDFSEVIIEKAKKLTADNLTFAQGNVTRLDFKDASFDLVLSERCIINMRNDQEKELALKEIRRVLKNGGRYLMLETSRQGIESLSRYRKLLGLHEIEVPWHNQPIDEKWLDETSNGIFELDEVVCFGTYFFISRIIHPLLVAPENPKFDAKINQVAMNIAKEIPSLNDEMSQIKIFILKAV